MANRFANGGFAGNSFTPGPGNYNTSDQIGRLGSGVTIGAKYGDIKGNHEDPGPGAYNLNDNKKSGVKIGTSKRTGLGATNPIPGPG